MDPDCISKVKTNSSREGEGEGEGEGKGKKGKRQSKSGGKSGAIKRRKRLEEQGRVRGQGHSFAVYRTTCLFQLKRRQMVHADLRRKRKCKQQQQQQEEEEEEESSDGELNSSTSDEEQSVQIEPSDSHVLDRFR